MGPWGAMMAGAGVGDILGGIGQSNLPNPANSAMPYFNQIPGTIKPYYQPYINQGNWAGNNLQNQYSQLTNNPGQFMNQMGQNFQQSPGYGFQVNQATGAANRAAAAGGMLGSPQEQQNLAGTVNGMANQDYYNWMNHAQNMYGMGLQGMQGMYNTGASMSNDLATNLAQSLMSQGNLAYAGQEDQNQQQGSGLGSMLGGLGGLAGGLGMMGSSPNPNQGQGGSFLSNVGSWF